MPSTPKVFYQKMTDEEIDVAQTFVASGVSQRVVATPRRSHERQWRRRDRRALAKFGEAGLGEYEGYWYDSKKVWDEQEHPIRKCAYVLTLVMIVIKVN